MKLIDRIFERRVNDALAKYLKENPEGTYFWEKILQRIGVGNPVYSPDNTETYVNKGYLFNPIVYSIVSYIAQKAAVVPWYVYDVKDEKSLKLYKSAGGDVSYSSLKVRKKALVENENHDFNEVLNRPNELQGWAEFIEQVLGFKLITGNSYVHSIGPSGGVNRGSIKEMWSLPAQIIEVVAGDKMQPIKGYKNKLDKAIPMIPYEEMIHLKYWTPEYDSGSWLYGLSPLRAGRRIVDKSNSSYDASVTALQNMGILGFVSGDAGNQDAGLTPEQAERIEERLKQKSGPKNWGKILVTSANLKWQQIGMSPVDLNIIEGDKMDLRMLCNVYHVPSELFGDAQNKTYSNTKEAGRAVYTGAVIPALTQFRDSLNAHMVRRGYTGIYVDFDVSLIPELQKDVESMVAQLAAAWWLNPNEKREMMLYSVDESEPGMSKYWIPYGLVPMDGMSLSDEDLKSLEAKLGIRDYR